MSLPYDNPEGLFKFKVGSNVLQKLVAQPNPVPQILEAIPGTQAVTLLPSLQAIYIQPTKKLTYNETQARLAEYLTTL